MELKQVKAGKEFKYELLVVGKNTAGRAERSLLRIGCRNIHRTGDNYSTLLCEFRDWKITFYSEKTVSIGEIRHAMDTSLIWEEIEKIANKVGSNSNRIVNLESHIAAKQAQKRKPWWKRG